MNPDRDLTQFEYDPIAVEGWARRPEESDWQYAAFQSYRNAGPSRTLEVAIEKVDRLEIVSAEDPVTGMIYLDPVRWDEKGKAIPPPRHPHISDEVEEWAKQHHWKSRCAAWDLAVQKQYKARLVSSEEKWVTRDEEIVRLLGKLAGSQLVTFTNVAKCPERESEMSDLPMEQQLAMAFKMGRLMPAKLKAEATIQEQRAKKTERRRTRKPVRWIITVCTYQPKREKEIDVEALLNRISGGAGFAEDVTEQVDDDQEYAEGEYDGTPRDYMGSGSIRDVRKRKEIKSDAESGPVNSPLPSDDVTDGFESAAEGVDAPPAAPGSDLMDADAGPGNAPSQRDELPEKFRGGVYDVKTLCELDEWLTAKSNRRREPEASPGINPDS